MRFGARDIGIAALVMLFVAISLGAPRLSTASRSARLGDDPAPGMPHPRLLEPRRGSARKPPPRASLSADLADIKAEDPEEDDEDEHRIPTTSFAGPFLDAFGPAGPRRVHASRLAGLPAPRTPTPPFLLCLRLVC